MKLMSKAFEHNGHIPRKYTCQGVDINPPLTVTDPPSEAKTLALIMDDSDVPVSVRKDRMWVHWIAFNIDSNIKEIPEGVSSLGIYGKNTGGMNRYMGPCPPDREHRYYFKLYALDTAFAFSEGITKEELLHAMEGHILARAELMGRYDKI